MSGTELARQIVRPRIVRLPLHSYSASSKKHPHLTVHPLRSLRRELDWADHMWPPELKKTEYPKVQLYCLMSVKDSYTDL
ncbi:hypothetical protein BC936DRAFT_144582 [Jimgerdemannia flammicorona]|uniref:[histone H3]-dimethyl-L-lysine(36) demethylase n=1 Tax=Jimgerdemannia flammicorona TaxID=994334 RepID=A0A433DC51_9FUNG|nr:hypothetical protein BC936DRAFT_144582 [Jimgerdemannia flammicorona]